MMPIVFCASFPPWPSEYTPADTSCSRRNSLSTRDGVENRNSHDTAIMLSAPRMNPIAGDKIMNNSSEPHPLHHPLHNRTPKPFFAIAAPAAPATSACDELVGKASSHVM